MRINKKISQVLSEISKSSIRYSNTPDTQRKYLRRLLRFYKTKLPEEEQLYLLAFLLEQIHYKNIVVDEETILIINNASLRKYITMFILSTFSMVICYFLFIDDVFIAGVLDRFYSLAEILRIKDE